MNIGINKLILISITLLITLYNNSLFTAISNKLEGGVEIYIFLIALITFVFYIFFSLVPKFAFKSFLIIIFILSAIFSYFNNLGVIFDDAMFVNIIDNIKENNTKETKELISLSLFIHIFVFGIIPSILLFFIKIKSEKFTTTVKNKTIYAIIILAILLVSFWINSKNISFFVRENRDIRMFINPAYPFYSLIKHTYNSNKAKEDFKNIGLDAVSLSAKKIVGIFIVGETGRADRFSINQYKRETNPLLKQKKIINFTNSFSCGTSTAYSLPCMFSLLSRENYSVEKAKNQSNILDILKKAGVDVLWVENNSGCKGICKNIETININKDYDESMLENINSYIDSKKSSVLIVLHSIGSHGPKYANRYPKDFDKFKPSCKKQPQKCSRYKVDNAYDNSILYTDYFINKTIETIKSDFVLYASDHGESLGENGIYLHGMPYFMAPIEQKHIPMLLWKKTNKNNININKKTSHDNLSHSIFGLFKIKTKLYNKEMDIFKNYE
jgi:lipid A ethanolaminephosphotransferase